MKYDLSIETIDTSVSELRELPLCEGCIPGATPVHITVPAGQTYTAVGDGSQYRIFVLIAGSCVFATDGKEYPFDERVTVVPAPDKDMTITATTTAQFLEILWKITPEDVAILADYKTEFPVVQPYATSIQYVDPNKSAKTISRMMIPHKIIPRFTMGSVESYGYDLVKQHAHPMLDQFFFSFPENKMDVLIDDDRVTMLGNVILYIPLGSNHGVEVTGQDHLHYMWIDFMPDNEAGLKRLDFSHRPTGLMRDLSKEDKFRDMNEK